jgi:hypothetical protein
MKTLLISLVILLSSNSFAESQIKSRIAYTRISTDVDSTLAANCSAFEFIFDGITKESYTLLYSIDGEDGQADLTKDGRLIVNASPGNHIFQFFTWHYNEVFTDSITISGQHRDVWQINMYHALYDVEVGKPVIYLYPQERTSVKVSIDIYGQNSFHYPTYENGWEFSALPNGDLEMNDQMYNYLFWEASAKVEPIDHKSGFIVEKNNIVSFLEKQLSIAGLTSKEQADFITYWAPQLAQHDQSFVHFIFNDDCDEFAKLSITPKPDNLYRIYMLWQPITAVFDAPEQIIHPMNRAGFTVLEWGGMELPALTVNQSL